MSNNLALLLAQKCVQEYAAEADLFDVPLRELHQEAMECRDCEDFLRHGISALKWLQQAEETVKAADYAGIEPITEDVQQAIDQLYISWFIPCERAEQWIKSLESKGFTPDNLCAFRQSCELAEEAIQRRDWQKRNEAARAANFKSEPW